MSKTPDQIATCKFWVKADTGLYQDTAGSVPATTDGDSVARWEDQSGLGYHMLQATGGNRPTWLADSGFKGLPGVKFDAAVAQQWLEVADFPFTAGVTSSAWVVAYQIDSGAAGLGVASCKYDQIGIASGQYFSFYGAKAGVFRTLQGVVVSLVYDGTQPTDALRMRCYKGLNEVALAAGPILTTSYAVSPTKLYLGRLDAAGLGMKGRIMEAAFFTSLSDADRIDVTNYMGAKYFANPKKHLICSGDSRTVGSPSSTNNTLPLTGHDTWPLHALALLGAGWELTNVAQNGQTWSGLINGDIGNIDALQTDWRPRQVVVCFADANDYNNGATLEQVEASITTYFNDRIAAGFRPADCYCGTAPWNSTPAQQEYIPALATWIRGGNLPAGVGIVDFQADSRFDDDFDTGSANYAGDGVHMSDAGNAALGAIAAMVIEPPPPATFTLTATTMATFAGVLIAAAPVVPASAPSGGASARAQKLRRNARRLAREVGIGAARRGTATPIDEIDLIPTTVVGKIGADMAVSALAVDTPPRGRI